MRRLLTILISVFVLVVVLVVWLTKGERVSTTVVLSDGKEVVIRGVVPSGTPFSSDKPWMKLVRRVLPNSLQGRLPAASSAACSSGNPNHVLVYFEGNSVPWSRVVPVDDDGFRYPGSSGSCSLGLATGQTLYGVFLMAFPRRQETFRVDFLNDEHKVIAQARLRNPMHVPPTEQGWQPRPLPATLTNGELALTLVTALEVTNDWGLQLIPFWEKRAFDPRWEKTRTTSVRITDPVGNEGVFLSQKEHAWQLSVCVHRERFEDFDSKEKVSASNLTVPGPAEMLPLNTSQDGVGLRIQLAGLYGPGTLHVTNGLQRSMTPNPRGGGTVTMGATVVESYSSSRPFAVVEVSGMSDNDELLARCWDEKGSLIPIEFAHGYRNCTGGKRVYQIELEVVGSGQRVSIETAVSRPKEFGFYIDPKAIQPPGVPPK